MFSGFVLSAQKGKITASMTKDLVAVGEKFNYILKVENLGGSLNAPDFSKFNIVSGPARSQGRSNVNGRITSYTSLTYTLVAKEVGQLSIGPASVDFDGTLTKSNVVKIKVVGSSAEVMKSGQKVNFRADEDKNVFTRVYVSKTKVYKGEPVIATFVLFSRYDISQTGKFKLPQFEGFWKEEMNVNDINFGDKLVKVNGIDYKKAVIASQVLIPQKLGKISTGRLELSAYVRSGFFNLKEFPLKSNNPSIEVLPLPSPPSSFTGAVGNFDFSVGVIKNNIQANDAINLKIGVSGKGNIKLIGKLEIDFDQDFEVYDPKIIDKISSSGGGMSGSRVYEYLIIPRYAGEYVIDPLAFSYFDPNSKKYITIESEKIVLNVEGDAEDASTKSERRKKDVTVLENDIRYINTDGEFTKRNTFFAGSSTHTILFSLPLLLLAGLWFYKKHTDQGRQDVSGNRIRKAGKKALKEIDLAKSSLAENKKEAFYESVFDAMYNYLSEKLSISYSDLTKESIASSLLTKGVDNETIHDLKHVLESCEMARFAPRAKTDDEIMLSTADRIIHNLEKQLS
jgi:hypothetical protein